MREAIKHLKEGHCILIESKDFTALACVADQREVVEAINEKLKLTFERLSILLAEVGMLYNYVEKIPELALDVVEFSERPIDMIYPKGKNLPAEVLSAKGEVKLRLVSEGPVHQFLFNLKRGLLVVSLSEEDKALVLPLVKYTLPLQADPKTDGLLPYKIMRMGHDGEVTFY